MTSKPAWLAFAVLFLLHQDFWFWDDRRVVLGFLPVGLAWHAAFSLAAACLWLAVVRFAWPADLEAWAEGDDNGDRA